MLAGVAAPLKIRTRAGPKIRIHVVGRAVRLDEPVTAVEDEQIVDAAVDFE
jgi:hypothetical protein